MGLAFYRFGHDIALRLASGHAFALKDAELGACFGQEVSPVCFLRGSFTSNSYRGLIAQGVIPSDLTLQDFTQSVAVQMDLLPELAKIHGESADSLYQIGLRLDKNSLTDEISRNLLLFDVWQFTSATPVNQAEEAATAISRLTPQADAIVSLVINVNNELGTGEEVTQSPPLATSMMVGDVVKEFFDDEQWLWEAMTETKSLLRSVYDGQNGRLMCYTRILSELDQVLFYSVCPISVPSVVFPNMLEFLNRVNTELSLGNFEIEFGSNTVRLRTSIDVKNVGLTPSLFRNMVFRIWRSWIVICREFWALSLGGSQRCLSASPRMLSEAGYIRGSRWTLITTFAGEFIRAFTAFNASS